MKRILKASHFFIFFCLSCFHDIGPYRDIEIVILGTDYATINFYNHDSTLIATEPFDREYGESVHVGYIEDGYLKIEVLSNINLTFSGVDTSIIYHGRYKWVVEF